MVTFIPYRYSQPKWQARITEPDKQFICSDGSVISSLFELKQALTSIDEATLTHHVNTDHHIANWVQYVVGHQSLADALRKHTHRWGLIVALEREQMRTLNLPAHVAKYWLRQTDYVFTFANGKQASSTADIITALENSDDSVVDFHLERQPNDIAVWVQDVIGDFELAELLDEGSNRLQMLRFCQDHQEKLIDAANQ